MLDFLFDKSERLMLYLELFFFCVGSRSLVYPINKLIRNEKILVNGCFLCKGRRSLVIISFFDSHLCINCGSWLMGYWESIA